MYPAWQHLLSVNPDLTYIEVKDAIESTAQKIRTDFYDYNVSKPNGMWNEKLGYGMVDAYAALESVFCHDDVFIESTDNITWSVETNLCENLIVEGVLTINAPVHIYSDLPEITIQNGGHLIFDTGSELYYRDIENFVGNINVEAGSTLEFKNGSDIVLAENGKIMVNHDSNNSGELVFNSGVSLTLLDNNTNLEIAGDLHIAPNATFTYTGDGYIKFSNPGGDATNNIFCGSGASIVLQGSGQNDKIMEVQQSSVRFPAELSSLELRDGKIEMGAYARMLAQGDYPLRFDNLKITSDNGVYNAHRSFFVYGQQDVEITDCVFEYGYYGLYGNLTYNSGAPLSVSNCDFFHNREGITVYNKGLHLNQCNFEQNTQRSIHCDNMSMESDFYQCQIDDGYYGIVYKGSSAANLEMYDCDISNTTYGLVSVGGMEIDLECNRIFNNSTGIKTISGTYINMGSDARNALINNNYSLHFNPGIVSLDDGYNQLQPAVNGKSLYGYLNVFAICGNPFYLSADYNKYNISSTPPVSGTDYSLAVNNCQPITPVYINAPHSEFDICRFILPMGLNGDGSSAATGIISESTSLSSTESVLSAQLESELSPSEYERLIGEYISLIETCAESTDSDMEMLKRKAWANMHNAFNAYYEHTQYNNADSKLIRLADEIRALNSYLNSSPTISDVDNVNYQLDNALLYRMTGDYDGAIMSLLQLSSTITDMPEERALVESWLCHVQAEQQAEDGELSPDAFYAAILDCKSGLEGHYDAEESEMTEPESELHKMTISPNPTDGSFTVYIEDAVEGSEIKILNFYSQPVKQEILRYCGTQEVNFRGLTAGIYTVYYMENGEIIDSEALMVR
jgi:hypothetical protein